MRFASTNQARIIQAMTRHQQMLVLIVEDHPETYELYSEILAHAGYAVSGTESGVDAYRQAVSQRPDLIIMDDELHGADAADLIRRDPRTRAIPILMMTGRTKPEQLEHARMMGSTAIIHKPCSVDELLDEVRRVVPDRHAILLVEDDDEIRVSLTLVLETRGFEVLTAANGRQAIDVLREVGEKPRLILLDLMMPVMDGWAFRAAQLADPALAEIPVVILSAAQDVHRQAQALHVDGFLAKPLNVPKLLETIETIDPLEALDRHV
jgi:CheY-like chemotaxis protein